jgi:hypothetical protein
MEQNEQTEANDVSVYIDWTSKTVSIWGGGANYLLANYNP